MEVYYAREDTCRDQVDRWKALVFISSDFSLPTNLHFLLFFILSEISLRVCYSLRRIIDWDFKLFLNCVGINALGILSWIFGLGFECWWLHFWAFWKAAGMEHLKEGDEFFEFCRDFCTLRIGMGLVLSRIWAEVSFFLNNKILKFFYGEMKFYVFLKISGAR